MCNSCLVMKSCDNIQFCSASVSSLVIVLPGVMTSQLTMVNSYCLFSEYLDVPFLSAQMKYVIVHVLKFISALTVELRINGKYFLVYLKQGFCFASSENELGTPKS